MKLKTLRKKIRRLEARLQAGAKKLGKLKRKLGTATTSAAARSKKKSTPRLDKAKRKSTPAIRKPRKAAKSLRGLQMKRRSTAKPAVKPAEAKEPSVSKKVKRKPNFTPQRRAQLATAMKARWAAKRAAAAASSQNTSPDQDLVPRQPPQLA